MATYKNKEVTVMRDARPGDKEYVEGGNQIVVKQQDGKEVVVARTEVENVSDAEYRETESLTDFLKRISQKLKNAQTAYYPPTTIEVAEEIDNYINTTENNKASERKTVKKTDKVDL